jgi:uncharacterized hydrophobic protein (TIGR00271 family)
MGLARASLSEKERQNMKPLSAIVSDFKLAKEDLPRIQKLLFYDGPNARQSLERYALLMFFATLIASYGVIGDSTATVIGAMLIAPLMTPVLAVAAAVVTGDMRRAGLSLLIVIGGVVGAIALALWIGITYRSGLIDVETNSQIVSRVSPRLVDLYAALGAGAVGAFATSREDIADTLPGAAIAIALVPPLAVVGLTVSQGAWGAAWGSMLLFLTNFFAILISGSLVLAALGLSAAATDHLVGHARRRAFELIALGALLVALPLAVTSYNTVKAAQTHNHLTGAVQTWLEGTSFELVETRLQPGGAVIVVKGEGDPPAAAQLISLIRDRTQTEVSFQIEIMPMQRKEINLGSAD